MGTRFVLLCMWISSDCLCALFLSQEDVRWVTCRDAWKQVQLCALQFGPTMVHGAHLAARRCVAMQCRWNDVHALDIIEVALASRAALVVWWNCGFGLPLHAMMILLYMG